PPPPGSRAKASPRPRRGEEDKADPDGILNAPSDGRHGLSHDSASTSACFRTKVVASSWPSGGYLCFLRRRLMRMRIPGPDAFAHLPVHGRAPAKLFRQVDGEPPQCLVAHLRQNLRTLRQGVVEGDLVLAKPQPLVALQGLFEILRHPQELL